MCELDKQEAYIGYLSRGIEKLETSGKLLDTACRLAPEDDFASFGVLKTTLNCLDKLKDKLNKIMENTDDWNE
jgi:hypothetical protein